MHVHADAVAGDVLTQEEGILGSAEPTQSSLEGSGRGRNYNYPRGIDSIRHTTLPGNDEPQNIGRCVEHGQGCWRDHRVIPVRDFTHTCA